ncbi:MAG: hypothetical protein RLZZ32_663 [Cyanobacteriota bacterium]|jgi:hypothetical protein
MQLFDLDLSACEPVNHLWPDLVERLGIERSGQAIRQALDLLAMRGSSEQLPALLVETCGVALVDRLELRRATALPLQDGALVLLLSRKANQVQLLLWQQESGGAQA